MSDIETPIADTAPQVDPQPAPAVAEPAAPSVRDSIVSAVKEVEAQADPAAQAGGRDDRGRFTPKSEQAAAGAVPKTDETSPLGAPDGAQSNTLSAPSTWRAEAKAEWSTVSQKVREEIVKREKDIHKGLSQLQAEYKQVKAYADQIEPVLRNRTASLVQNYGSLGNAVDQLFKLSDFANQNPRGFVEWFSKQNNLDQMGGDEQATADPELDQLRQTVNGLQSQLQQVQGYTQHQQITSIASDIQRYAEEKDASGNPLRPHFEAVRPQIMREIGVLKTEMPGASHRAILEKAYEHAIYLNPETRESIIGGKLTSENSQRDTVERARRAALANKSITGTTPSGTIPVRQGPRNDLRAEIAAAMQAAGQDSARL